MNLINMIDLTFTDAMSAGANNLGRGSAGSAGDLGGGALQRGR